MKRKLGWLSFVVLVVFLMAGSAGAVSFAVNDLILNSKHSGGSPAKGDDFIGNGCALPSKCNGASPIGKGVYSAIWGAFDTFQPHQNKPFSSFRFGGGPFQGGTDLAGYFTGGLGMNGIRENGSDHRLLRFFASNIVAEMIRNGRFNCRSHCPDNDSIHGAAPVPEPATVLLLGTGLLGVGLFSRHRRKRQMR